MVLKTKLLIIFFSSRASADTKHTVLVPGTPPSVALSCTAPFGEPLWASGYLV